MFQTRDEWNYEGETPVHFAPFSTGTSRNYCCRDMHRISCAATRKSKLELTHASQEKEMNEERIRGVLGTPCPRSTCLRLKVLNTLPEQYFGQGNFSSEFHMFLPFSQGSSALPNTLRPLFRELLARTTGI